MNKINILLIPFFFFNCYYLASMEEKLERYNGNNDSKFNNKFTEYAEDLHAHHTRYGHDVFLISCGNLKEELEELPATRQIEALSIMINHVVPKNKTVAEELYSIVNAFFSNACAQGYGEIIATLIEEKIVSKQEESTLQLPLVERLKLECSALIIHQKEKEEVENKEQESTMVRDFCEEIVSLSVASILEDPEAVGSLLYYLGVPPNKYSYVINQAIDSLNDSKIVSALKKYVKGEVRWEIDEPSFNANISEDIMSAFCYELVRVGPKSIVEDPKIIEQILVNLKVPRDEHLAIINEAIKSFICRKTVSALEKYVAELNKNTHEQTHSKKSLRKSTKIKNKSNLMGRVYRKIIDQFH